MSKSSFWFTLAIVFGVWCLSDVLEMALKTEKSWLGNCALHRPLADCKIDYEKLHR